MHTTSDCGNDAGFRPKKLNGINLVNVLRNVAKKNPARVKSLYRIGESIVPNLAPAYPS